ncbi:MAG: hypothetical protein CBB84_000010 [Phycisphaera sp. TMED24]|nr:MAG: hypothetical protein CBB84_000010 [Phycisphaera sp. TMED24]|tara:strand:+ start:2033 stop:3445 length:1413 start_codon:yes stop_codon:yes gene_type:complete
MEEINLNSDTNIKNTNDAIFSGPYTQENKQSNLGGELEDLHLLANKETLDLSNSSPSLNASPNLNILGSNTALEQKENVLTVDKMDTKNNNGFVKSSSDGALPVNKHDVSKSFETTFVPPVVPSLAENDVNPNTINKNEAQVEDIRLDDLTFNINPINDPVEPKKIEPTEEDIKNELRKKQELLFKLHRMEKRGVPLSQKFSMASSKEDIEEEFFRLKSQRDLENSIRFQRKTLMAFVSGIEFLNTKFDPFDAKLDGWSETIHENINDYDDVFEELHEKYKTKGKIAPELKLLMMVGGSATMFHMTNSIFKTAAPDVNQIFRENPDLAQQFGNATMKSMANNRPEMQGFANFMGGSSNGQIDPSMSSPQMNNQAARPDMRGPSVNVDEILSKINSLEPPQSNTTNSPDEDIPIDMNQVITIEEILDSSATNNDNIREIKSEPVSVTSTKSKPSRRRKNSPNSGSLNLDMV